MAHALFVGVYVQDKWKILPKVTLNYGARFDLYYASFDKENQPSPRVNLIYQPTDSTTLHAGYARYFTPPPLENVPSSSVAKFDNTSNASGTDQDDPVKAERANYYDVGISQKLAPGLQVGRGRLLQGCPEPTRRWPLWPDPYPVGVQLCRGPRSMAWSSAAHTRWAGSRRMPTWPTRWPGARTGTRRNSCSTRRTSLTSRTTGSIWTTTSGSLVPSARPTFGSMTAAARASTLMRFMAAGCGPIPQL